MIGVVGASLIVTSGVIEMFALVNIIKYSEASLSDSDYQRMILKEFAFLLSVVIVFIARIWILVACKVGPYRNYFASSAFAFTVAFVYVVHARWFDMFVDKSIQECVPEPARICFGIYDMTSTSWILVATVLYVWLSVLRTFATAVYAVFAHKYK